jgi:hypothetical protein
MHFPQIPDVLLQSTDRALERILRLQKLPVDLRERGSRHPQIRNLSVDVVLFNATNALAGIVADNCVLRLEIRGLSEKHRKPELIAT